MLHPFVTSPCRMSFLLCTIVSFLLCTIVFMCRTIRFLLLVFPLFPDLCDCLIESLVTGITARERLPLEALRSQSPVPGTSKGRGVLSFQSFLLRLSDKIQTLQQIAVANKCLSNFRLSWAVETPFV